MHTPLHTGLGQGPNSLTVLVCCGEAEAGRRARRMEWRVPLPPNACGVLLNLDRRVCVCVHTVRDLKAVL